MIAFAASLLVVIAMLYGGIRLIKIMFSGMDLGMAFLEKKIQDKKKKIKK